MKENNLAEAIDLAAQKRAEKVMQDIRNSVISALKPYWRPDAAGDAYIGDDVRNVLLRLSGSSQMQSESISPSPDLVNHCRGAIINDLLKGLPKLRELAMMAGIDEMA